MKKRSGVWASMRDFWKRGKAGFALFLLSLFGVIYGYMALAYELTKGWQGHVSVQNVVKDISAFIPVDGLFVGMIIGGIDIIMLLSDWYLERQEKRIQAAKAEGIAEGEAKGKAEGIAEGEAKVYRQIANWDNRRKAAESRGEPFTESPPGLPQHPTEQ